MAPKELQQQFTDLRLENFAHDGSAPKAELAKILKAQPEFLQYTFTRRDGQKTNFLVELLHVDKAPLAMMVMRDFKDKIPEAMIKGYKPDDKSPALNPLPLAVRANPALAIELLKQGADFENVTSDGGNIFHAATAQYSPQAVGMILDYAEKNIPEEKRKTLFAAKDKTGKTPLDWIRQPHNLLLLVDRKYITKRDMESFGGNWIDARNQKIWMIYTYNPEFDTMASEMLEMHDALDKAGIKRTASYTLGEKYINFGRADANLGPYCQSRITDICKYADRDSKNKWLAKAVAYQSDMRFSTAAARTLVEKGAAPADQSVLNAAIYSEDIEAVKLILDTCKNNPAFLDTPGNSSLRYAITCGFAAEHKRLPIIALVAERGGKVTADSYHVPMGTKIAGTGDITTQKMFIDKCRKLNMPYPAGLEKTLQKQWADADKMQAPAPKDLKDRADLLKELEQWDKDDQLRQLLKNATSRAPETAPAITLAAAEPETGSPPAALPMKARRMVRG